MLPKTGCNFFMNELEVWEYAYASLLNGRREIHIRLNYIHTVLYMVIWMTIVTLQ